MKRKIFLAMLMCMLFLIPSINAESVNQNYTKEYKEYLKLSEEEKNKVNVIPRKYEITYSDFVLDESYNEIGKSKTKSDVSKSLPSKYFLGDDINLVVDYQGSASWCWAFTSLNCVETNYLLQKGKEINLAEYHLAYCRASELGGWRNEITIANSYFRGGNFDDFKKYAYNGFGPVTGENDENKNYNSSVEELMGKINSKMPALKVSKTIDFPAIRKYYNKDYKVVGYNMSDEELLDVRNRVKEHIMTNGAVYAVTDSSNYDKFTNIYNINDSHDHAITIVGWDDNYSKNNFPESLRPAHDGAYIIQNSWGTYYGDKGYYYVSYDDAVIEKEMSGVVSVEEVDYKLEASAKINGYLISKNAVEVVINANQPLSDIEELGWEAVEEDDNSLEIKYVKYYTEDANEDFYVTPLIGNESDKVKINFNIKMSDYGTSVESVTIKGSHDQITLNNKNGIKLDFEYTPSTLSKDNFQWMYSELNFVKVNKDGIMTPYNNGTVYVYIASKNNYYINDKISVKVDCDVIKQNSDYKYKLRLLDGEFYAEILQYLGHDEYVEIPEFIDGARVIKIADEAFYNNKSIIMVQSGSVNDIGNSAFYGCSNLKAVIFEDNSGKEGIEKIGSGAFANCTSLCAISANNVEIIGDEAFKNCTSMKYFYLSPHIYDVGVEVFANWTDSQTIVSIKNQEQLSAYVDLFKNSNAVFENMLLLSYGLTLNQYNVTFINDLSKKVTYSINGEIPVGIVSTNTMVAQVQDDGIITPKSNGKCKVLFISGDGVQKVICDVTVNIPDTVLKGDFNGNSTVDVTDAYLLLTAIAKNTVLTESQITVMDFNNDKKIDVTDAYLLLKVIASS